MLIDVTRLLDRMMQGRLPTGVDRVGLEYVRHFSGRAVAMVRFAGQWIELPRRDTDRIFDALLSPRGNLKQLARKAVGKALPLSFARRYAAPRFLFNTGHSGLDQAGYFRRLRGTGLKPLFFVHDLIPLTHPEYCRPGERERHQARMDTVLKLGAGVIVNSQATLDALKGHARKVEHPMPPAVVAQLAPARLPSPADIAPLDVPYFVVLGTIEPRKNHWLLLKLWRQLIERLGNAAPRLVVIGQRGWECENVVDLLERCEALKGFVFERPGCSDAELSTYLHHARALLFPSFTEGYGLPLVEALTLGVPVIASDLPAFREIAGDIPDYLDPLDGARWSERVLDYARPDSPLRLAQCQRMGHFLAPTWEAHFQKVESLMDRLASAIPAQTPQVIPRTQGLMVR